MDIDTLCKYADLLHEEGYTALEILSRPLGQALTVMGEINKRPQRSKILWGLGTMRSSSDAFSAVELRPDFLVSPAFSPRILQIALQAGIPYIPGVHTFQDVQSVLDAFCDYGLTVRLLKLCPVFGLTQQYVEALCSCFPGISFCPTGEVEIENYLHWKQMPGIVAPMGSKFVPRELLEAHDWSAVRLRLRQLRALAKTFGTTQPMV